MSSTPRVGGLFTHHKGRVYRVLALARHTETNEELVIYTHVEGLDPVYARPLSIWLEPVHGKPRFTDNGRIVG